MTQAASNLTLIKFASKKECAEFLSTLSRVGFYQQNALRELAEHLIGAIEQALAIRDNQGAARLSEILACLPTPFDGIGLFYKAVCHKRERRYAEAINLLEQALAVAPPAYQTRAIQSLANIHQDHARSDEAMRLYLEAARLGRKYDLRTLLNAQWQISSIRSEAGDHKHALSELENLLPLVRLVSRQIPFVYYAFSNDLAYELGELGRFEEALRVCRIALASPFASAYPEWRETPDEIAKRGRRASRSVVALSNLVVPSNIVPFSAENTDGSADPPHVQNENEKAPVFQISEWTGRMAKNTQSKPKEKTTRQVEDMDRAQRQTEIMRHILDENTSDQDLADFLKYIDSKRSADEQEPDR